MPDNHRVIVAGGNPGAELFAVVFLKIPFRSDKDIGGGVQPEEFGGSLFGQVVRDNKNRFLA